MKGDPVIWETITCMGRYFFILLVICFFNATVQLFANK